MSGAPLDGLCTAHVGTPGLSLGACAPIGAPALTFSTATNRPTTTTGCRQVVGDTLC
jgi:hypothetical protein